MKNIRIYQAGTFVEGKSVTLDKVASNHLIRVLRLKNNQPFTLFNGDGGEFSCRLEISGKTAITHINSFIQTHNESPLSIHLFQGISKGERMDFAIQKAVELGVHHITPVFCERTVVNLKADRLDKKLQHWQSIAISACEQSGRNIVPKIHKTCSLQQALELNPGNLKLMLEPSSKLGLNTLNPDNNVFSIYIGPEGGFSDTEIMNAKQSNVLGITLGPRILRTETAALSAITAIQLLWGDLG